MMTMAALEDVRAHICCLPANVVGQILRHGILAGAALHWNLLRRWHYHLCRPLNHLLIILYPHFSCRGPHQRLFRKTDCLLASSSKGNVGNWSEMSTYQLTPEQVPLDHQTRQPALWAPLIAFIIINNLAIFARIWIKWGTTLNRKRVTAEDVFVCGSISGTPIDLSAILVGNIF